MNYQDDYASSFIGQEAFQDFLDDVEREAFWRVYPTNELVVVSVDESLFLNAQILSNDSEQEIIMDTRANTGLVLKVSEDYYPIGTTAIKTLENRARISGYALQDLSKEKFARVINDCLEVTKGNALIRFHEGKVRAVHGGDKSDYSVLSMPEIFEAASIHMKEQYDRAEFMEGYFDHYLTMAAWEIRDEALLNTYRDMLLQYGLEAEPELSGVIRIYSSDVGVSGANIFYFLLNGKARTPLVLGDALRLEHSSGASLEDFSRNLNQVFARYQESIHGLSGLFTMYLTYPANVMARVMKKVGIGMGLTAKTTEQFKATHGYGSCSAYEVYCGICEVIFIAQCEGAGMRTLTDLEEKVSRCLKLSFEEFDLPGTVQY